MRIKSQKLKFFLLPLLLLGLLSMSNVGKEKLIGDGEESHSRTLDLKPFHSIDLSIDAEVILKKGNLQKVEIVAEPKIIDQIQTQVRNGVWDISFPRRSRIRFHKPITIYITVKELKAAGIGSSGSIIAKESISNPNQLNLSIAGSGDIIFENQQVKALRASIAGSGNINVEGQTDRLKLSIAGSGKFKAYDLKAKMASISIAGSGRSEVFVEDDLDVRVAGSGDVYYQGEPRVSISSAGSGKVRKAN
ncbi:head GIN domain-containing protein [Xanthovirga aplysinae]|uniref:head GIN domain-containing protein n=1 Tax=Xanthovirga aplysinae TaxID=2529853 RepID=UPI0012BBBB5B|nr:head GIN domain-containing protein [Xanthovirga aplysinae]MTI30139.1 DUF2807 domain-containing protein [Xanthovirga aplysinae]